MIVIPSLYGDSKLTKAKFSVQDYTTSFWQSWAAKSWWSESSLMGQYCPRRSLSPKEEHCLGKLEQHRSGVCVCVYWLCIHVVSVCLGLEISNRFHGEIMTAMPVWARSKAWAVLVMGPLWVYRTLQWALAAGACAHFLFFLEQHLGCPLGNHNSTLRASGLENQSPAASRTWLLVDKPAYKAINQRC
jgi:hypothetical protein